MTAPSSDQTQTKVALVVLGMHRSGTSAMAGMLARNGAGLPDNLMAPGADNPTGFWESADVADLNDEILARRDSHWDDVFSGVSQALTNLEDPRLLDQAHALIEGHFDQAPLIVLKDPRVSVLSRFWHDALVASGYEPRYVIMVRHPLEVAGSLTTRNQFSREKGVLLWASYMIAAEKGSRGHRRIFVTYESLLQDWRSVLDRVETELGTPLPRRTSQASIESDQFLQSALRHHVASPSPMNGIWPPIITLYDWFKSVAEGKQAPNIGPDQADEDLRALSRLFGPILAESQSKILKLGQANTRLEQSLDAQSLALSKQQFEHDQSIANLKHQLDSALESAHLTIKSQARQIDEISAISAEQADLLDAERRNRSDLEAQRDTIELQLNQKTEALTALQHTLADLAGRYNAVVQSTSWRMTGPVRRWLSRHLGLARRLRAGLRTAYHLVKFKLPGRPVSSPQLEAERARLASTAPAATQGDRQARPWQEGWPVAENPTQSIHTLGAYDHRPDDHIVRACQNGRAFFERYALLGEAPQFDEAASDISKRRPTSQALDEVPDVSIVIPVYGQLAYTLNCLDSLIGHQSRYSFEILVGDDASPDQSEHYLKSLGGIHYVRHAHNLGFIGNCNTMARLAKGRFIVMLNNDTRVAEGWLDELIGSFDLFPKAGLIGSKLYYPDGRLQEAGGIVWQDGSAWNYGRQDDPNRPAYTYARQVDYVSGAAIAIPLSLWASLGGFDPIYKPAYYEDTDIAFRIRALGLEVWMQPLSGAVHYEGVTSGTDIGSGTKAYQAVNQQTFLQRWRQTLSSHRPNGQAPLLERERTVEKRVLILDVTAPTPNQDAGSVVVVQIIAVFQALGYKVSYLPLDNWLYQPEYIDPLRRQGVECLYAPYELDLDSFMAREGHQFNVVHVFRFEVMRRALATIKKRAPRAKLVFNNQDIHYLRVMRQAEVEQSTQLRLQAHAIKSAEIKAMNGADLVCTLSQVEKEMLDQEPNLKRPIAIMPYMIDLPEQGGGVSSDRRDILFLGSYGHSPNKDAAKWLVEEIWPRIRSQLTDARLVLAGANPTPEVLALAAGDIIVPGRVEDLGPLFASARVFVAPLRYGAGVKGKIYSAFGYGVPVVTTSIGAEGMGLIQDAHALIADDAETIAEAILKLASNDPVWLDLAKAARTFVETHHTTKTGAEVMGRLLDTIEK